MRKPDDSKDYSAMRSVGLAITIPAMLAATALIGCGIGFFLDRWLGTSPWLLILFILFGFGAGIRETISLVRKINDNKDK